jgi:hypothetical protein
VSSSLRAVRRRPTTPYIRCGRTYAITKIDLPNSLKSWAEHLAMIQDKDLRAEFYRIQEQFAMIIYQDVVRKGGMFYTAAMKPSNAEIDKRLLLQGDDRTFLLARGGSCFLSDVGKPKC